MIITEIITIILVILKLCGTIECSWFTVLLPEIIAGVFYTFLLIFLFKKFL